MRPLTLTRPCDAAWHQMTPAPGGRHCAACDRSVYDLSGMTEARVRALLLLHGAQGLCGRQVVLENGELLLASVARLPSPPRPIALAALALAVAAPAHAQEPTCDPATTATAPTDPGAPTAPAAQADAAPAAEPPPSRVYLGGMVSDAHVQILEQISFQASKAALSPASAPVLDALADALNSYPQILKVAVSGHASADEAGRDQGKRLGQKRAEVVREALIARGVDPARLVAVSWGTGRPLGDEASAQNRRVSFAVCDEGCELPP